jgi:phosphate transport system protein
MFRELLSLFRASDAIATMGRDFNQMLDAALELTVRAGEIFFGENRGEGEREEISKRDVVINKLERSIRKQVIVHLTLSTDNRDVSYCLLLMSIVKDVERIGDYAKNLAEVHSEGGAEIPDDEHGTELRELRRIVESMFAEVSRVFASSDSKTATALITQGRAVNRRCDALIASVTRSDYGAATTTSLVLGARYYKRIGSHLLNVLSGVVMPLHKLDYYDEDALPLDQDPDDDEAAG